MRRRLLAAVGMLLIAGAALAQQQSIPTPQEYLGYELGTNFTTGDRISSYFEELAKRSDLVTVQRYGQTYERRPLLLATIASPKNRAALDTIHRNIAAIANGETVDTTNMPAIVLLQFGVHGNEASSAEAAMLIANTLLSAPSSERLLDNLVVLIDPLQNPDGRERYVRWYEQARGIQTNADPDAYEHREPWPRGRYNHYMVDMNRDWTWLSQRETQARVAAYQQWYPQVVVDFHEMGYESSYFFPPVASPVNVNFPGDLQKWFEVFGRANADAFSRQSWPFFVAERYDFFYPGYGDAWPSLHGAVGMTYEVAGQVGVAIDREDGTTLTLRDRVRKHYTTGMATLQTAAAHRAELLKYTSDFLRSRREAAGSTYLIPPDSPNAAYLVDLLRRQGIRVSMLAANTTVRASSIDRDATDNRTLPPGTAVVTTKQPLGSLVQTLLEKNAAMAKEFLDEQRVKSESDEPDDFYDLTTWSMPLAMNVDAFVTNSAVSGQMTEYIPPVPPAFRSASYGYLVDALDPRYYNAVGQILQGDIRFSVSDADLNLGDKTYRHGSIIILRGNNGPALDAMLSAIAKSTGVSVVPLQTGWMGGTAFGSEKLHFVKRPKIALIGGSATVASSFGMLWHTLDVQTSIPHTVISSDALRRVDLSHYNVLVMPDGDYRLAKREVEKLQNWLRNGGTVIAVKGASAALRDKDAEISKLKPWELPKKKDDDKTVTNELYNEPRVPGSAFRTKMNERSYLTFGVPRSPVVLIEGSSSYLPASHLVDNIVTIEEKDPLVSGVAWKESIERIKGSAYLVNEPYGKGNVITFADEPHFRLFWRGTLPLFLNAVIYSPTFTR